MSVTSGHSSFELGFFFLVEVGVNLTNPVDRVSLSLWTGRAVIQAYGCGHPWRWNVTAYRRRCWSGYDVGQASATYGFDGTVCGTSNPSTSAGLPCSRSHGNTVPSVSSLVASTRSPPLVVPTRADLETVKRMMKGDTYIGRGCKQRRLPRSVFGNPYKLCKHSRLQAVAKYRELLDDSLELSGQLINLSCRRLLCHCKRFQQCHGDAIIAKFVELYPGAYDRDRTAERVPTSEELNLMAILRSPPVTKAPLPTKAFQTKAQAG